MKNIKMLLAVLSSAALVFAGGCGEKKEGTSNNIVYYDSSNSYSQEAEGYENSSGEVVDEKDLIENIPTTPVSLGENAELSGFDIKITNVYNAGLLESDQYHNYDRQVVVVVYEVTNNNSEDMDVTAFDMSIRYMDGEETKITTSMEAMLKADEKMADIESLNATLKPGETIKGYTAFSIYPRWDNLTVYYNPQNSDNNDSLAFEITKDMLE